MADDDFLLDESDPILQQIRERRMQELRQAAERVQEENKTKGIVSEFAEQDYLFTLTSAEDVVIYFYNNNAQGGENLTSQVVLELQELAQLYQSARFYMIDGVKNEFLTHTCKVKVLPSLLFFHKGTITSVMRSDRAQFPYQVAEYVHFWLKEKKDVPKPPKKTVTKTKPNKHSITVYDSSTGEYRDILKEYPKDGE
eukprot:TRINITY_DN1401_c0_g1_i1.p1 TRINITY_DN1401_c0_g1~~TRINITY_DN1401_c0_g1_i1.p1  ORF type:complete len:197 (-),score=42.33 TRINITY_DN1401_c0_g1_i1:71-661(-)